MNSCSLRRLERLAVPDPISAITPKRILGSPLRQLSWDRNHPRNDGNQVGSYPVLRVGCAWTPSSTGQDDCASGNSEARHLPSSGIILYVPQAEWEPGLEHRDQASDFRRGVELDERAGKFSGTGHDPDLARCALSPKQCVCQDKNCLNDVDGALNLANRETIF